MGQRSMTKNVLSNLSSILYAFPKKCATLKQEFLADGLCDLKQRKENSKAKLSQADRD